MLAVYSILLFIVFATIWILSNDRDDVHHIAATSTAVIVLIWFFSLATISIKLLFALPMLLYCQRINDRYK